MDGLPNRVPPTRAQWLMHEIGEFLAADATDEQRHEVARLALRNGHHSTAGCGRVTTSEDWPFGLQCAEQMTVPARARLHAAARDAGVAVQAASDLSRGSAARGRGSHRPGG